MCAFDALTPAQIPGLLADLVDKSMVQLVDADVPRYRLLETLREFGLDQLTEAERAEVRDRHCRWYLGVAERGAAALAGPQEGEWVARLERDVDNLRAAHVTALERRDADAALRLVAALREFAFRHMRSEITAWAEEAMGVRGAADHPLFPLVCSVVAYGRFVRGESEAAIELGERALAYAEAAGVDCSGLAERAIANVYFYRGESETAIVWTERMLASARASGSAARLAHALYMRSVAADEHRRQCARRAPGRRGARRGRRVWLTDALARRSPTRWGSRSSRPTRPRRSSTSASRQTPPPRQATGGWRPSR